MSLTPQRPSQGTVTVAPRSSLRGSTVSKFSQWLFGVKILLSSKNRWILSLEKKAQWQNFAHDLREFKDSMLGDWAKWNCSGRETRPWKSWDWVLGNEQALSCFLSPRWRCEAASYARRADFEAEFRTGIWEPSVNKGQSICVLQVGWGLNPPW